MRQVAPEHALDAVHGCLELLLDGWKAGFVDHDARPRDERLERDPAAVRDALLSIAGALATIR